MQNPHSKPPLPVVLLVPLLAVALTAACIPAPRAAPVAGEVDRKLGSTTFIEEGSLLALVVGTRPATIQRDAAYLPLEVAVANKGLESLTLTPESFTLVTSDGTRLPIATRGELSREYGNTDRDRRLAGSTQVIASRFAEYRRIPANFTPGFVNPSALDRVALPRFGYMLDFLYFPRPDDADLDAPLDLVLTAAELDDPIVVRFEIARPGGRRGTR